MMEDLLKIGLFGDCGTHGIAKDIKHTKAIGLINWLSIVSDKPDIFTNIAMDDLSPYKLTNYQKRVFLADLCRGEVLKYLSLSKADFLLMDCNDCRLKVLIDDSSETFSCITYHDDWNDYSELINRLVLPYGNWKIKACYEIERNLYYEAIKNICSAIKQFYRPDEIILHKHFFVTEYLDKGRICKFARVLVTQNTRAEELLKDIYAHIEEELEGCHIINFPDNVLGDRTHPLGIHPMHYNMLYYEYGYKAIKVIEERHSDEKLLLEQLRDSYSNRMKIEKLGVESSYYKRCLENRFRLFISAVSLNYVEERINLIRQTTDISSFLDMLFVLRKEIIVCAAVKDTPGSRMKTEILNRFHDFGFLNLQTGLWMTYVGLIYCGNTVRDKVANVPEEMVKEHLVLGEIDILLVSKAYRKGNIAELAVNGKNYAVNMRGINLIVIDPKQGIVVDSVAYDSHLPQDSFVRG